MSKNKPIQIPYGDPDEWAEYDEDIDGKLAEYPAPPKKAKSDVSLEKIKTPAFTYGWTLHHMDMERGRGSMVKLPMAADLPSPFGEIVTGAYTSPRPMNQLVGSLINYAVSCAAYNSDEFDVDEEFLLELIQSDPNIPKDHPARTDLIQRKLAVKFVGEAVEAIFPVAVGWGFGRFTIEIPEGETLISVLFHELRM